MATELFANVPSTTVTSGGTTAPVSGTVETWTVASSASFPAALATAGTTFHVADPAATGEMILVTNVSGTTWTVTRGAEGSVPVVHAPGFTVVAPITAGTLGSFPQAFSVVAFGADPGGTSDSHAAFAACAAAAAGAVMVIPQGSYKLGTKVTIPSNTVVTGYGFGSRIFMANSANLSCLLDTSGGSFITIRNLQLDGNKANQIAGAVTLIGGSGITEVAARGVYAHDSAQQGIYWGNAVKCTIEGCYSYSNGISEGFGFGMNETTPGNAATASWGNRIVNCYAESNTEGGYSLFGGAYNSASRDNLISGCTANAEVLGFNIFSGFRNVITGCKTVACTTAGIQAEHGAHDNTITGNNVDGGGTGTNGIGLNGSATIGPVTGNTVTGNTVTGSGSVGIFGTFADGGSVSGNTVTGSTNRGIHLISCNSVAVTGNTAYQNGQDGIRLDGCTQCAVTGNIAQANSQGVTNTYHGILLNESGGTGTTFCTVTGNNASDDQPAVTGALTANASSGQANITVSTATAFAVFAGQHVTIGDVTDGTETSQILSVNTTTGVITMTANLANSYLTANGAALTGVATQKWGILENSATENFNTVTANVATGNRTGQISLSGASDVSGLNIGPPGGSPFPGQYLCAPSVYAPGTQNILAAVGGTLAAFSSASINTGPFIAPPSGSVVVGASFVGQTGSLSTGYAFGLVGHGTTTMYGRLVTPSDSTTGIRRSMALTFPVGTLTAGTSYNFDLATANTGTYSIYAFGQSTTTPVLTSAGQGAPVVMTVQAV